MGKGRREGAARPWGWPVGVAEVGCGVACTVVETPSMKGLAAGRNMPGRENGEVTLKDESTDLAEGDKRRVRGMENGVTGRCVVNKKLDMGRGEGACPY